MRTGTHVIESIPVPFKSVIPCVMAAVVSWPDSVRYKGRIYYWYDKAGSNKAGLPSACYKLGEEGTDERVWLDCDGTMIED